ncbi:glycosyltransferase [Labilibaculum sp. DW002]|uniref:Glycosyltransferase n=1 Tax=Paralabilibaculum antarcticum TaxID=2912572 RepID=A0ABT5VQI4_9BACT|nr:glycosyltransferase [Labilibaculum sp. DW002]MDE5417557.1 glycosyltransferase [Labilibaculum sp. DW002]
MITFFYRNPKVGFSIGKVFKTITDEMRQNEKMHEVFMPSEGSMPWDLVKNSWFTFKHRNKAGINHITGHIHDVVLGLFGCKIVLTIHDLVFLDNVKNPIKRFYKWLFWLYLPIKLANKVVCISNQTKNNILAHIKTDKLFVIENPIDPMFKYLPKEFNKEKPVILHIGTGWNKNLLRVVEALIDIPCHLRIVGKLSVEQNFALKKSGIEYSTIFNISDLEIKEEYVNCDIVSFPSEYEGFGMPIIEGQKTGRVVVTSQIEPLIEVSGDAVEYVKPLDVNSIREGFLSVIKNNDSRNSKIALGQKNVERYAVSKIAEEYKNVYKSII